MIKLRRKGRDFFRLSWEGCEECIVWSGKIGLPLPNAHDTTRQELLMPIERQCNRVFGSVDDIVQEQAMAWGRVLW